MVDLLQQHLDSIESYKANKDPVPLFLVLGRWWDILKGWQEKNGFRTIKVMEMSVVFSEYGAKSDEQMSKKLAVFSTK